MARMKILNQSDQEAFETPPQFTSEERKCFFNFTQGLLDIANRLIDPGHKIGFLVACGYFRATKKLFPPDTFHQRDISYVMHQLNIDLDSSNIANIPETTRRRHRKLILKYYGFHYFDQATQDNIVLEISEMARKHLKPKLIFWRCTDLLIKLRIALPSYHQLSELILKGLNNRKKELTRLIDQNLTLEMQGALDELFAQESSVKEGIYLSKPARYKLTLLKKPSHSTKPAKVKERAADLVYLKTLYGHIEKILPLLNLGHDGIRYYAKNVIKSDMFQINQRANEDRYIHTIAFIAHQYYRLQDNLADVMLSVIQSFRNSTTREYRDWCYDHREDRDLSLKSLLSNLDDGVLNVLSDIQIVLEATETSDSEKLMHIQALVNKNQTIFQESQDLKASIESTKDDEQYYKILGRRSIRLQNRITPIVKALSFEDESVPNPLMKAIEYFKEKDGIITKHAPLEFLDKDQYIAVTADASFHTSLYKVYLFMNIASAIKSGTLNLKDSHKYRPLDDYLISKERWGREKQPLIDRANLQAFINPTDTLQQLDDVVYQRYQATNTRHLEGGNPYLRVAAKRSFTIAPPKQDEDLENKALKPFFPEQYLVPLCEVLSTVNQHSGFLLEFQHWQQQHVHSNTAGDRVLYAGIMGYGCAIGTQKIARISNQINANNLDPVINWYFSLENLHAANDRILMLLDKMALPDIYRRLKDKIHSGRDGQKREVQTDSLNANYSFKYFGKDQGVSVYTFVDERNFMWHSLVFSAAERESAYVIDGLMRNDVVKTDIHSTDSHGYSESIFAVTHLLGFAYAPRIKNLKKQNLYIFKSRHKKDYPEWKITPDKYVNEDIIIDTWDDILRLVCTIKLKETTASEIFRRLNSYSKQHRLYQGLKAFGQIIKSEFILNYLNDVELRQSIEKQLNKVELANRFTKAVAVGDPRGFTQAEREDQEIAESCNRLIKNSIICWNYLYLSDKLARLETQPQQQKSLITAISTHSVMSWAHINMLGEYDFSDEKLADSFNIQPPKFRV